MQALLHAYGSEEHRHLSLNTCGVIFLGTPFRGSGASSWGVTIAHCASTLGLGANTRLLKTLEEGSERLDLLLNDFTVMAKLVGMKLVCFYELRETRMGKLGIKFKTMVSCITNST